MKTLLPGLALLLCACATVTAPTRYTNPVIDQDFPDPAVVRGDDDAFYVYATQGGDPFRNIQAARSHDLIGWAQLPDVLPVKPHWASRTQDFWAPDVIRRGDRWFLFYSAKPDAALSDDKRGLCLAVATASGPGGPFTDKGSPLLCGDGFVNIDPFVFEDPATGKTWLYWGSGFGPIKVQELGADLLSFAPGSRPIDLVPTIKSEDPAEYRRLVEGAWVTLKDGYYYLFFSGDNCCGPQAHYATMVARSRSATGPFDVRERPLYLVLEANGRWVAPGHNSVIRDDDGTDWILYHGVDAKRPRTKPGDEVNTRRVMLMDRLEWVDGWPQIRDRSPTDTPQPGPVVRP